MANLIEDQKLIQHEIHDEMKNSYIDYAMSVIVGRALPDVRDGLKPVHRRILYGMSELGVTPDKPYKKSARIVGEVMGKYHPHGDSSIYDAMVRMAQDFSMRYMFVDGHGNFGSVDGDGAAAMRYTEARMSHFSMEMLRDIKKETVDFMPNFDEEEEEPTVLPARIPNLLVNGSNGIAVGMATSIPPHNLCEAIDACVMMIDNKDCTAEDLMTVVKGPDFPTGAIINGKAGFKEAYKTGIGKVTVRAKTEIEEGKRGRFRIIVTEIPYQVNKARLIEKIALLIKDKKIEGISDIRDESSREGMRIVIELKKDANPQITLNRLYKHTQLQENISMIMIALVNGEPRTLNLRDIIFEYLKHQKEVLTRRTQFDLAKAEARAHIVEGLRIALDNIDEVIKTIRSSYDDAKERLMEKFGLSEIQAQAILDMRLARLQGLERDKLEEEYKELMKKIAYYKSLLADEKKLMGVVKDEMLEIREKWGDERKTEIVAAADEIDEADLIEEEQVSITLTHLGYIKRIPADTYKTQKRGGRGVTGVTTRENDFVTDIIMTSTHQNLAFFTNYGKAYVTKAYEIPEATRTAKGTPAVNFLNLMQRERINAIMPISKGDGERYLIACTKKGTIKKTAISEFVNSRRSGLVAIKLKDGDELVDIRQSSGDDKVLIITKNGKCICFPEDQVRPMGRAAGGVRAISLDDDDAVVSMELVQPDSELLVVTQKGYGKRTAAKEYREQKRGGKGLLTYDKTKFNKTGELIGATVVTEDDEIMLINSDGIIIRIKAKGISKSSRATQGVKIMKVAKDANIISLAKVGKEQQTDADGQSGEGNSSSGGQSGEDGPGAASDDGKKDSNPEGTGDSEESKTEESEQMTLV